MLARKSSDSISVACPACGYESMIRIDRLAQKHLCRSCGTPYRVNHKGNCVVDHERKTRRGQVDVLQRLRSRLNELAGQLLKPMRNRWHAFSLQTRWILLATVPVMVAVIGGAWLWTAWITAGDTAEEPESLIVRSEVVGRALVYGDGGLLAGFTAPETLADAQKWLKEARHNHWGHYDSAGNLARVQTRLMFKNESNRQAGVLCQITAPTQGSGAPATATVDQMLFWSLGRDGKWVLDGARTWKEHQLSRPD